MHLIESYAGSWRGPCGWRSRQRGRGALAWLGMGLLVAMQFLPINPGRFPEIYTVVVLAAVLMVGDVSDAWFNRKPLSHPVMVYIGRLSYPYVVSVALAPASVCWPS